MSDQIAVGLSWGCPACGAPGPLLTGSCSACAQTLDGEMALARKTGARLYHDALVAARSGRWTEGIELTGQALKAGGTDPGLIGFLGLLYREAGRVAEALAAWRDAGPDGPHTGWAHALGAEPTFPAETEALKAYNHAVELALAERWSEALAAVAPATHPDSRLSLAFVLRGLIAWVDGQPAIAEVAWRQAMELDRSTPGLLPCLTALVDHYWHQVARSTAAAAIQPPAKADDDEDNSEVVAARWAVAILSALVIGAAGSVWVLSQEDKQSPADAALAAAATAEAEAARQQALNDAKAAQEKAAQLEAETAAAAAKAAKAQAQTSAMTRLLDSARELEHAEQVEALVAAIGEAEKLGVTVPDWITAILPEAKTRAAVARYFEGYQAFMADHFDNAVAAFEKSLALDGAVYTADDAAYLAAKSLELAGNHTDALTWYERVLDAFPDSLYRDDATYFAGRTAELSGAKERAVKYYQSILDQFPDSGYAWEADAGLARL